MKQKNACVCVMYAYREKSNSTVVSN